MKCLVEKVVPVSLSMYSLVPSVSPIFHALSRPVSILTEPQIHQCRPSIVFSITPIWTHLHNESIMACQHETMKFTTNVGMKNLLYLP